MMTSFPSLFPCFHVADYHPKKTKFSNIKVNGNPSFSKSKIHEALSHKKGGVSTCTRAYPSEKNPTNPATMLTKPQNYDEHVHGLITEEGGYKQIVAIRAYEMGPDKAATIQTIFNLLQNAAMCHSFFSGLIDGGSLTRGMRRHNLLWVVSTMQVEVHHYPAWGETVEIETWIAAIGRIKIRRDWVIRSHPSGVVLATATSTRVLIDTKTKRVSKIPDEVRAEISPFLIEKQALKEDTSGKIEKLNDNAKYASYNLKPMWSDLDLNYHVSNVHYIKWILEPIPHEIMKDHQISSMVLEYKRECRTSDIVQSLCEPQEDAIVACSKGEPFKCVHLLQIQGETDTKSGDIVRVRTLWKRKMSTTPCST